MTVLVFGRGFLGARLAHEIPSAILHPADITDATAVRAALDEFAPRAVVNAAGKTGRPNVDWCETHKHETHSSNVVGPLVLARACAGRAYLLHLGSGCIFDGPSPRSGGWREDDVANARSFYAKTKYAADLVLSALPGVGIARIRMPVDAAPGPRNLITKLASHAHVIDVENSVTFVDDLVTVAKALLDREACGVFHVTNPGTVRHRDLLALYKELVDPSHAYELIAAEELGARGLVVAPRSNAVLASDRLGALGISMRPADVALRDAMTRYAAALRSRPGERAAAPPRDNGASS